MAAKKINRREFITDCGIGLAGAGLVLNRAGVPAAFGTEKPATKTPNIPAMEYRTLGRTNLKVSSIGLGVMRLQEPAVLFKALEMGINIFDTAHEYQNGNNEKMIGKVLKEFGRKKAFVMTKIFPGQKPKSQTDKPGILDRKRLDEMMDLSLKRLQSDYVDILLAQNIMDANWLKNETLLAFLERLKKEGKARFVGISLHDPRCYVPTVDAVIASKAFDVLLAWYNFKSPPSYTEALQRAGKANVGIIAMKTQLGGYTKGAGATLSPHQAALRWALDQEFISSTIPGMVNFEQLQENVGALGSKVGWSDRKILHAYYNAVRDRYCVMCGKCTSTCGSGVDIHTINRALMYCEGYGDYDQARRTYCQLGDNENGLACLNCASPTCRCVNGIKLAERARRAHAIFV
jgi:aryl-alcohol dehydrogenase-like predicted oxidoreductase